MNLLARHVCKFTPFPAIFVFQLHKLQDEGTSGHNARTTWEEITTHHRLEHTGFTRALPTNNHNGGKHRPQARERLVTCCIIAQDCTRTLQPVDNLHKPFHGAESPGDGWMTLYMGWGRGNVRLHTNNHSRMMMIISWGSARDNTPQQCNQYRLLMQMHVQAYTASIGLTRCIVKSNKRNVNSCGLRYNCSINDDLYLFVDKGGAQGYTANRRVRCTCCCNSFPSDLQP